MKTKKTDEYTFVNYPEKRAKEDYAQAIRKIVELHKDMEEVIALYRFGSISAPGISDIDYFVVTQGKDSNFRYKCPHDKLTQKEKYLFQHYPSAVLPKRLLSSLHLLAPFFELECIYSRDNEHDKKLVQVRMSKEEATIFLADGIFMLYPKIVFEVLNSSVIDVQNALKVLHSVAYAVQLCSLQGIKEKKWQEYANAVEFLRIHWFEEVQQSSSRQHQTQSLVSLLNEAFVIILEIIERFDAFLQENRFLQSVDPILQVPSFFLSRTNCVIFRESYAGKKAMEKLIERTMDKRMDRTMGRRVNKTMEELKQLQRKNKVFISVLPATIAAHLGMYAQTKTLLGNYVKHYLYHTTPRYTVLGIKINETQQERSIAVSNLIEYSVSIKYFWGTFSPFNIGYLNHRGIVNHVKDAVWDAVKGRNVKKQMRGEIIRETSER